MKADFIRDFAARPGAQQFARFAAAGATATVAQYCVLVMLVELAHLNSTLAAVLAYLVGALTSYLLNIRFTFKDGKRSFGKDLAKFMIVNLLGLGINTLIFVTLRHLGVHYLPAQAVATGLVLIWNYAGARLFVFRN